MYETETKRGAQQPIGRLLGLEGTIVSTLKAGPGHPSPLVASSLIRSNRGGEWQIIKSMYRIGFAFISIRWFLKSV